MSIFEYDEEKYLKSEREVWRMEGREEGITVGHKAGYEEAEKRFSSLMQILLETGRNGDVERAVSDQNYREQLYQKYHL